MTPTLLQFLIVCPLACIAGFIDSIAGGGGLITLPAYLIAGLPVHYAIGTNKVSSSMGISAAVARYAKSGFIPWKQAAACVCCAFAGSVCGAKLALVTDDRFFKIFMLLVLPVTAIYVTRPHTFSPEGEPYPEKKTMLISMAVALLLGVYDGFYGPGTGTFLLLLLTGLARMGLEKAQGVSKAINFSTNIASVTVYLINRSAVIPLGIAAGVFSIAGNLLGSRVFISGGARSVRPVMLTVIGIFIIKVILELFGVI